MLAAFTAKASELEVPIVALPRALKPLPAGGHVHVRDQVNMVDLSNEAALPAEMVTAAFAIIGAPKLEVACTKSVLLLLPPSTVLPRALKG